MHRPVTSWGNACSTCMHQPVMSQVNACTYCMGSKVSSLSRIYLYLRLLWILNGRNPISCLCWVCNFKLARICRYCTVHGIDRTSPSVETSTLALSWHLKFSHAVAKLIFKSPITRESLPCTILVKISCFSYWNCNILFY